MPVMGLLSGLGGNHGGMVVDGRVVASLPCSWKRAVVRRDCTAVSGVAFSGRVSDFYRTSSLTRFT